MDVYYAAYGSNLLRARFMTYLAGGSPEGSQRIYPPNIGGTTLPTDDRWFEDPTRTVFFGGESTTWTDPDRPDERPGMAFLIPREQPDQAPAFLRAYRITWEQFKGVVRAENTPRIEMDAGRLRDVGGLGDVPPEASCTLTGAGAYDRLLVLGSIEGVPVLSFTSSTPRKPNPPAPIYLRQISNGTSEARARARRVSLDITLCTPRVVLRPVEDRDTPALWPFVSQPDFPRFMNWDAHGSPEETQAFIAAMREARDKGTDIAFAILHEDTPVGMIGLHGITRLLRAWWVDRAEMGYWIGPPYQNRGFVTEVAREVMRFGFEVLGLHKITIGCVADNAPSRRVIEKLGFRFVGVQRHHLFRFGRWWDHLSYEVCADEPRPSGASGVP